LQSVKGPSDVARDDLHRAAVENMFRLARAFDGWSDKVLPQSSQTGINKSAGATSIAHEYRRRRQKLPDTADAHVELGTWCMRIGLKAEAEAEVHFLAALELDCGHAASTAAPIASG
jgi:hypothetical protein